MIRRDIIECFRSAGVAPDVDQVAARLGTTREALLAQLESEPPLEDLAGLSIEQAWHLMRQFLGLAIFTAEIETEVAVTSFYETREKIREFERKARGGGKG